MGAFRDKEAILLLSKILRSAQETALIRAAALEAMIRIGAKESREVFLALLAQDDVGPSLQVPLIEALGREKAREAVPRLVAKLRSDLAIIRSAAATALGQIGGSNQSVFGLLPILKDPDATVRDAVIQALGQLEAREAIPGLIELGERESDRTAAIRALAAMPDVRAVPLLVRGLVEPNPDTRGATALALARIRDAAAPRLQALALRNELPRAAIPELVKVYAGPQPIPSWHVVGPFDRRSEVPFPPSSPIDLARSARGIGGKNVTWTHVEGDPRHGAVDLNLLFPGGEREVYAYHEFEADIPQQCEIVAGSDDTLTIWLNGKEVYNHERDRGWSPDQDRIAVVLNEGVNRLLARCGNTGGDWKFSIALSREVNYAFLKMAPGDEFDPESYRLFASEHAGDPARGKKLFGDSRGLDCLKCHSIAGTGGTVGPDLTSVGAQYSKDEIAHSVLYPSAKIFSGYEPLVVATTDGRIITGILKTKNDDTIELVDSDAHRVSVPRAEIDAQKPSDVSLMPSGLAAGVTKQDFADLLAYLASLRTTTPQADTPPSPR
jgi:putative heme-binding domain-containing protein